VAVQLGTPQLRKTLETAVQREVNAWFTSHQQILQSAAQKEVDVLTSHLQAKDRILQLGAAALTSSDRSAPALHELERLANVSTDQAIKDAANGQITLIASCSGMKQRPKNGPQESHGTRFFCLAPTACRRLQTFRPHL
jgi:hypothetical protein